MIDKISDFCRKANHIIIFLILLTIFISILYMFASGFKEGGRYNRTTNPPAAVID